MIDYKYKNANISNKQKTVHSDFFQVTYRWLSNNIAFINISHTFQD